MIKDFSLTFAIGYSLKKKNKHTHVRLVGISSYTLFLFSGGVALNPWVAGSGTEADETIDEAIETSSVYALLLRIR